MELTWERHEIEILDQEIIVKPYLQITTKGLDTNAQNLHQDFISNLPHLSEVSNDHMKIISQMSSEIEMAKMNAREHSSMEDLINEYNGEMNEKGITLPIKIRSPDEMIIQSRIEKENQIIRIISPSINGGIFRSFTLPDNHQIGNITSGNGMIEILFR